MKCINAEEDKIISKHATFFLVPCTILSYAMFLSVAPKVSEIRETYYEKNTKERLIIQGKKNWILSILIFVLQYFSHAKNNKVIL